MVYSCTHSSLSEYTDGRSIARVHLRNLCSQSIALVKQDSIVLERASYGGFGSKKIKQHPLYPPSTGRPVVEHKSWRTAARDAKRMLRALMAAG